jgi:cyclopropane fatty-acyl-phospholipid synthase-like methyltransferase
MRRMSDFDRWQNRFASSDYVFGTEPNAFLAAQRALLPARGRALALADGEGRNGVWLATCGLDVVLLDFAPNGQAKAAALARERGVAIATVLADVTTWSYPPEAFDVVVVIFTQFMGPIERARYFANIRATLKPGGLLVLEGYTPKQLAYATGGPKTVENTYTRALLEEAFGDFTDIMIREYDAELHEGANHVGPSALIDFTGRKPRP